ncbi:hypothetical protein ABZ934_23490 [Streptomyces sp. NPDC046557]
MRGRLLRAFDFDKAGVPATAGEWLAGEGDLLVLDVVEVEFADSAFMR